MESIDQALFNFSPRAGLAVAVMVGFLVFAVGLDLTWDQFRRVLKSPKAPGVGLLAQYLILPAAAFGIGMLMAATPSIALGLLLVTCCPAGALSNYLTGVARGSVATSVSMTAISTLFSIVVTPLLFAFWASMNPETRAVIERIEIEPLRVVMVLLIMLIVPVAAGMLIRARNPATADNIRHWVRRIAGLVFAVVVAILLLGNISVLGSFASIALPPVLVTFTVAVLLGWGLARASGLVAADRRAVTLEVAFQNVALAIGLAVASACSARQCTSRGSATDKRLLWGSSGTRRNGSCMGALPPGSHGQSVGGVSDRISAKAGKQVARDVTNCRKCEGATG